MTSHYASLWRLSVVLVLALLTAGSARACVLCEALGCASCAVAASDGPGYVLQGGQWPQPGGDGSPVTITYSYNNFLDGGLRDPDGVSVPADFLRSVTEEAFGLWAAVAPLHFVEVADVGTQVFTTNSFAYRDYPDDSFGQIRMNHRFINGTDAQNGMPAAKAIAYFPSNGRHIGGDIHFDNGDPWAIVGTPSEPDVLGIMTHEIGHTLGLGHSDLPESTMFPAAPRRSGLGTGMLHPADIAGVRAIYGAGVGSVTPLLAVPEPSTWLIAAIAIGCLSACRRGG
ncbi:matrixin family metalloprotease [Botrimarina sp.]|uniref:matrixin family metalloprotease n=1 Tax=Botrimarina sp. TaxID=2795802 RepID=UPI0032EF55DF